MESGNSCNRDTAGVLGGTMKLRRKSKEELKEYDRRIEEVFRKHGLMPKRAYGKGYKAFFLNGTADKDSDKSTDQ